MEKKTSPSCNQIWRELMQASNGVDNWRERATGIGSFGEKEREREKTEEEAKRHSNLADWENEGKRSQKEYINSLLMHLTLFVIFHNLLQACCFTDRIERRSDRLTQRDSKSYCRHEKQNEMTVQKGNDCTTRRLRTPDSVLFSAVRFTFRTSLAHDVRSLCEHNLIVRWIMLPS